MSQISPPFRIALVALLAVCALWFTVLRPKPPAADAPLPAAPGTTGLANDVKAAKGAASASAAANDKLQAATGGTAAKSAPKAAGTASATAKSATPGKKAVGTGAHAGVAGKTAATATAKAAKPKAAAKAADPSIALLSALDKKHAVVLLFWNRHGSDDRAVRAATAKVDHHHGRAVVKLAPIADVGRYAAITKGVQVLQSPTVLVIAPGGKARQIAGFTTTGEIDQAVSDALAAVKRGK